MLYNWVSDGFEALRTIREDKPDLLILDYQLPRMNGIDLYDKIHALPGFEYIHVIMVSAQLPKREIEKCTLVGISKPFELGELFDTLEQFLA
ncbi:MAG: response regulator [Ktedonobacteraceae bacterium]